MDKGRRRNWTALFALATALTATVSIPALAEKGGRGRQLGVPDVNLGLSEFNRTGAGAAPGASGLTPASGMTPPGQLATPGLRLGNGNAKDTTPTALDPVQPGNNGNGLALGHLEDNGNGSAQGRDAVTGRIATTPNAPDGGASQGSGPKLRQLPTCR